MTSRYAALSREELATLVPELLLIGQLIDRSGMAWCICEFGREEMLQIAIEEWAASSPLYTKRMQKALKYEGVDIFTLFKGLQLDIGAPPQFMDFRYTVHDRWHGEFYLDHCGALLDVEPMGEDYVRGHVPRHRGPDVRRHRRWPPTARLRFGPIHRPPRMPSDQHPHCSVDGDHRRVLPGGAVHPGDGHRRRRPAHTSTELDPIDPNDEGMADYSGELLSDVDFGAFSHSALVRIADEVCLQMHLLVKSFTIAVEKRAKDDAALARSIRTKQLIGIAGVAAERIHKALRLSRGSEGRAAGARAASAAQPGGIRVGRRRPGFRPRAPVAGLRGRVVDLAGLAGCGCAAAGDRRRRSIRICAPRSRGTESDWTVRVIETDTAAKELPEVEVCKFSGGASWVFEERKSLPLTVV